MFENRYPIFKKGSILEKKELDLLRDNPVEIMELMYLEAKDGIIKGFDLETDEVEKVVVVKKGILKYKGKSGLSIANTENGFCVTLYIKQEEENV